MVTVGVDELGAVLLGKTRGAVLSLLYGRPDEPLHVRQISRLCGAGIGPVHRELVVLTRIGIVQRNRIGAQVFYTLNRSCPVYNELRQIVLKTAGAGALLAGALAPLANSIRAAFVFGSVATGRESSNSDVDVLVVGDVTFLQVARALAEPQQQLGRDVNPMVYPPAEFASKLRSGHHFLNAVLDAPKLFLIGDEHELARLVEERLVASARRDTPRNRRTSGGHRTRSLDQRRSGLGH